MRPFNIAIFLSPFIVSFILALIISAPGLVFILSYFIILGMVTSVLVFVNFLKLYWNSKRYKVLPPNENLQKYKIAVVIATFNEDPEMVLDTALSAKLTTGEYGDIFVLDDSTDEKTKQRIDQFKNYGIKILRRSNRRGYKADAINNWLQLYGDKYDLLAIFDADQRPLPFLFKYISQYFADENIAFVQIPQYYSEISTGVSLGAFYQQMPFLRLVMRGRNNANSAFSLGSGTVYRTKCLKEIGGLDDSTITEDISTALDLHSKGWKSFYIDQPLIWYGMPPKNIAGYLVQQGRWSLGGFQLLPKLLRANLSAAQFFDYYNGWLYWLSVGPIMAFELLGPLVFLLLGVYFFMWNPLIYLVTYLPYFSASLILYLLMVKKHGYGLRGFFYHHVVQLLAFVSVTSSFVGWLMHKRRPFAVTPKGESKTPRKILFAFTLIDGLLVLSTAKGIFDLFTIAAIPWAAYLINIFWSAFFVLYFSFGLYVILSKTSFSEKLRSTLKPFYIEENEKMDVLSLIHDAIELEITISDMYLALADRIGEETDALALKRVSKDSTMHANLFRLILKSLNYKVAEGTIKSQGILKEYNTELNSYRASMLQDFNSEKTLKILTLLLETERYINEEAYIALMSKIFEETLTKTPKFEENMKILERIRNDEKRHILIITLLRGKFMSQID